jgi:hypothetical protein
VAVQAIHDAHVSPADGRLLDDLPLDQLDAVGLREMPAAAIRWYSSTLKRRVWTWIPITGPL